MWIFLTVGLLCNAPFIAQTTSYLLSNSEIVLTINVQYLKIF